MLLEGGSFSKARSCLKVPPFQGARTFSQGASTQGWGPPCQTSRRVTPWPRPVSPRHLFQDTP
eukprot:7290328-Pyramimonas_sp.AAC.1